jgi:hypothetical protein
VRKRTIILSVIGSACALVAVLPFAATSAQEVPSTEAKNSEPGGETLFWLAEETESRFVTRSGDEFMGEEPTMFELSTTLSGAQEVSDAGTPGAGDPNGTGSATITITLPTSVCWNIAVQNVTTPAIAAHIHEAPAGQNGDIVLPLAAPDLNGTSIGCTVAEASLVERLLANAAGFYVNVHTSEFPAGAIRGQLAGGFEAPQPGDRLFIAEDLFASDASAAKGDLIGHTLIECVFGLAESLQCDGTAFITGRGQLHLTATVPTTDEPASFDIAIVGGTGDFADAGGDATLTDQGSEDTSPTLYEVRVKHFAS